MTGDITTRIAEIIVKHSICDCGEWAENFEENARHVAEQIVHQLKSHQGEYTMGQAVTGDITACRLCQLAIETRKWNITILRERIAVNEDEIVKIRRGDQHTDQHAPYVEQDPTLEAHQEEHTMGQP